MKYFLILNPGSQSGKSKKRFSQIFGFLDKNGVEYDYQITKDLNDVYEEAVKANKKNYNVIVAVGGDGTINKALNGFYDNKGKRISSSKMGVIYTGTSPDFCKSYDIPYDLTEALEALVKGFSKNINIGKIVLANKQDDEYNGKPVDNSPNFETKYFGCCVNVGLGAALARSANGGMRKYLGDFCGTFISLFKVLINYKSNDFHVLKDGKKEILNKLYNLSVGKTFYIASGIKVKNNLQDGDGRFYNLLVRNIGLRNIPGCLKGIYSGKELKNTDVISLDYSKTIEVFGNKQNPEVEFDGDPQGFLPCKIEMALDPLDIIVRG